MKCYRRLVEGDFSRRFVCITIDDGYRDTLQWAYPILKRYDAPFAVYIPTSFPDRLGELWWLALEAVVARNSRVTLLLDGEEQGFECATVAEKRDLFDQLYRYVRSLPTEEELRVFVRDLSGRYHVDIAEFCNELCMTWERARHAGGRSAGHDRRAHGQSRDAGEGAGAHGALRDGHEPLGDRGVARQAAGPSVLSGRRQDLGRPARVQDRRASSASRPR